MVVASREMQKSTNAKRRDLRTAYDLKSTTVFL